MAELNFAQRAAAQLNGTKTEDSKKPEYEQAQVYANIGLMLPMQNADGTVEEVFVSIPRGVAFDIMEPMTARGNNPEYNRKVETGNFILAEYQKVAATLKPGETMVVDLKVQLLRRNEQGVAGTTASGSANPLLDAARAHIAVVK